MRGYVRDRFLNLEGESSPVLGSVKSSPSAASRSGQNLRAGREGWDPQLGGSKRRKFEDER